ncbi:MAG: nucleotidyltransferase domain-containing protein [Eggerthellaceae bacterium]|nr:nucleotidyltransferase domain-containing protein [Eggerthellaceae bacterium]
MMNAFAWANDVKDKLEKEFGDRLVFVGLQGSRARGEAREDSDIDLVVLLDHIDGSDLERYRTIIQTMPYCELACGFIGSKDALAAWPRHELLQFYHDTKALLGALPEIGPFTKDDAIKAAHIGASGIYHATCHTFVFNGDAANDILKSLFKSAFFTLQALQFTRTGNYPCTKKELARQLEGDEARILEIGRNWQEHQPTDNMEQLELVNLLLHWSEKILLG